jgi:hypothetical protein
VPLTDLQIRNIRPTDRISQHSDDRGLFVEVHPNGSMLWRFKYRYFGKQKRLALGRYPQVGLAEARRRRDEGRRTLEGKLLAPGFADRRDRGVPDPDERGHIARFRLEQIFLDLTHEFGLERNQEDGGPARPPLKDGSVCRLDVYLAGDDAATLEAVRFRRAPLHLQRPIIMDCDGELRAAQCDPRVWRQHEATDRDALMLQARCVVQVDRTWRWDGEIQ